MTTSPSSTSPTSPTSPTPPSSPSSSSSFLTALLAPESRKRRLTIAAGIYLACTLVFAIVAAPQTLREHTPFNHYALLADAWLHGRQDLANGPPGYAQNNDFASFEGKTYITFPPFPALLMMPFVALAGSPEDFRDGQFMIELAGLAPAFLFLILEKLRRPNKQGDVWSPRSERFNVFLSLLFAFGTVYFFTAEEGTVWFSAHIVGAAVGALYVLYALDATSPLLAGTFLACDFATRPPTLLVGLLFALEAIRVHAKPFQTAGSWPARIRATWDGLDKKLLGRDYVVFAIPILFVFAIESYMNHLRFHTWNPNVGHEYLTVVWAQRMRKWGLFHYHFLAKNLGVALSILPWMTPEGSNPSAAPFQINEHGLAIWFTMPFYLWILWPRKNGWLYAVVAISASLPAAMELLYQNSGWRQFGYRFSNDYAILIFVLLAIGGRAAGWLFRAAAAWGVAWNLFGAMTFDRAAFEKYYFREGTQTVLYQPD
jgi:hypothetical protein